ncbi:CHAT domain-containing protein [Coleofasciculus sp. E2-BRE-01]|uniref:CHAT domain-containing protein n=1 Tax=Coleofasciculus sp. E2-BRE-01 TaxID=3069524 RepID=UPI0032F3AB8B
MGLTKHRCHLTKLLTWLTENSKINSLLLWTLVLGFFSTGVEAQPVVPANDGTNTQVDASGNKFTITGGQTSGDGANLFHSFSEFGLDANQTANFITNPDIQTILSRVTGGNASLINGLIQVTGGNSHLFLMNPAGIVFGQNARLDVPASFTATTATGIGFGENWFSAIASNNYTSLVGQPDAFRFNTSHPGAIINGGNLEVGKDLSLVGGTVVSTGNLEAANGQITITTVPGESTVRLSQPGHLLSLEVPATETSITPLSLPELLTGSVDVPDVGVNSSGTAEISASRIPIESGDIVAKNVIAETATLTAQHNLTLVESQLQTTGNLNLLAQDTVRVRDSVTNFFLAQAGGNLYIQGNHTIDILALNHPQTPFQSGGDLSLVSDGDISGDAHFASGGHFSILNLAGNPGNFVSYFDPIISVDGDVTFGDYNGVALKIEATGSIIGGNITITGPDTNFSVSDPDRDIRLLASSPSVILRAGLNPADLKNSPNVPQNAGNTSFASTGSPSSPGNITVKNITTSNSVPTTNAGSVILNATGDITIDGTINTSDQSLGNAGNVDLSAAGNILVNNIVTNDQNDGNAGSVTLLSSRNITINNGINTNDNGSGNAGSILLKADSGNIIIGNISVNRPGNISTSEDDSGNSGSVELSASGDININGTIDVSQRGEGELGSINLSAEGSIRYNNIIPGEQELRNQGLFTRTENAVIPDPGTDPETPPITNPGTDLETPPITNPETNPLINPVAIISPDLDNDTDLQIAPEELISGGEEESPILTYERTPSLNPEDNLENPENPPSLSPEDNRNNSSDTSLSEPTNQLNNPSNPSPSETNRNPSVSTETPSNETNSNSSTPTNNSSSEASSPASSDDSSLQSVDASEENFTRQFVDYLGLPTDIPLVTLAQSRNILSNIEKTTGVKSSLLYISFVPPDSSNQTENPSSSSQTSPTKTRNPEDQLELLLVTANGLPIRKRIPEITRQQVLNVADQFRLEVTNIRSRKGYIAPGKQLYDWLVAPMGDELQALGIENVTFLVDYGLRSIPIAALYDGQQFLIEKYSVGLMPSLSLVNPNYAPIENLDVLAMGAAQFTDQKPLPAVPLELSAITQSLWQGKSFLNETFTLENLKAQRQQQPFGIIHLATHANFQSGEPNNSYIQLWDRKLRLNQLPQLDWNNPPVELLVLSACRTALGNEEAELGFAGLAVQAGAKSAVGSLWYVSDEGTLGLMTQLYQTLKQAPIKAEALRQTQLAMLEGQVYVKGGQLIAGDKSVPLPPELARLGDGNFEHPYYWSAFTMVGSPW